MNSNREQHDRRPAFQRNEHLEALLARLQAWLAPAADRAVEEYRGRALAFPVVLIVGPPRSGTSLMLQILAASGGFAYPSNLLSRFYTAPILGAMIQRMLSDPTLQFRDEFCDIRRSVELVAANGKTSGLLAPNEFWYFWRRFLPDGRGWYRGEELERTLGPERLRAELAGLTAELGAPFVAKGMLFNHNIPDICRAIPRVLFVRMCRDSADVIPSLLAARRRQFGDVTRWYSFQVPAYSRLRLLSPLDQVAGQVRAMEDALTRGLAAVPPETQMQVDYAQLCRDPAGVFDALVNKLRGIGWVTDARYQGPERLEVRHYGAQERDEAEAAYRKAGETEPRAQSPTLRGDPVQ